MSDYLAILMFYLPLGVIGAWIFQDCTLANEIGKTIFQRFQMVAEPGGIELLLSATGAAFVGAILGRRMLEKVTFKSIRIFVGSLMLLTGALVATGVV